MAPFRTCRALALAGVFMCALTIPPAVHAQSTQPVSQTAQPSSEGEDGSKLPVSLERIREGIQREPKLKIDFLDPTIPLFRVSVHEKGIKLEDYWKIGPDTAVSRDVRPYYASTWHNEFLSMTTPKQQIAASAFGLFGNPLYPIGPPVFAITSALKSAFSNMERGRIRRQIQEELKALEANNEANNARQPQTQEAEQTTSGTSNGAQQTSPESTPRQPAPRNPR
jgi:hypothetical protein